MKSNNVQDLKNLINDGFTKVDKRFTKVDKRFTEIDERFNKIDSRFTTVDKRFKRADKKINSFIEIFMDEQDKQNKKIEGYRNEVVSFKDDVFTKMDSVYKEVVAMRQEQSVHSFQHEEIDDRLKSLEKTPVVAHDLKAKKR